MNHLHILELPLEGVLNVRELGGLPLRDGRIVAYGKLIRTGRLSEMTSEDKEKLTKTSLPVFGYAILLPP